MVTARMLAPERIQAHHEIADFNNGKHPSLNEWLRLRALASEGLSARTYVLRRNADPQRVIGYYAISAAMAQRVALPNAKLRRGMPDHVPLLLIGRLALETTVQGKGLGTDLLRDALHRCLAAADIAGARGVIAHAIDDEAARFYVHHGFMKSPLGENAMLLPMETARALLGNH